MFERKNDAELLNLRQKVFRDQRYGLRQFVKKDGWDRGPRQAIQECCCVSSASS